MHRQFSLLSTDHAYVTFAGKLLGVIRRSRLVALQSSYADAAGEDPEARAHTPQMLRSAPSVGEVVSSF